MLHGLLHARPALVTSSAALLAGILVTAAATAQTDNYPSRPITIVVPFPPGGSSDIMMRLSAQRVTEDTGHTFVIENRPGAGGNVAAMAVKNAAPDGYQLMMGHTGTHAINPTLYPDLKFDPVKDFAPITALLAFNNILVVPAASPAHSVAELVALAKSKPEGLTYGTQGIGTGGHLLGVLLAKHAGIKLLHVPYRGVAPAVTDTVAGRVDLMFSSYLSAAGHIEGGRLRMLAIAGTERHPNIADVPTLPETGYPDVQMQQWFGLFAPAGTPKPIVDKLNAAFVKALNSDAVKTKVLPQVAFVTPSTPDELGALVTRDIARLGQVVRESGAKVAP